MSHHCVQKAAAEWPYNLPLFMPQPQLTDGDRVQRWDIKHLEELSQHAYRATGSAHILPGNMLLLKYITHKLWVWQHNLIPFVTFWALHVWWLLRLFLHMLVNLTRSSGFSLEYFMQFNNFKEDDCLSQCSWNGKCFHSNTCHSRSKHLDYSSCLDLLPCDIMLFQNSPVVHLFRLCVIKPTDSLQLTCWRGSDYSLMFT